VRHDWIHKAIPGVRVRRHFRLVQRAAPWPVKRVIVAAEPITDLDTTVLDGAATHHQVIWALGPIQPFSPGMKGWKPHI
jgi:hypothetical protein